MSSISLILIVAVSLLFSGIVIRTKSILSGRKGPGILQPLKDVWRLFRKGAVYSETSSFIFRIAPSIYFSTVVMAIFLIPNTSNDRKINTQTARLIICVASINSSCMGFKIFEPAKSETGFATMLIKICGNTPIATINKTTMYFGKSLKESDSWIF